MTVEGEVLAAIRQGMAPWPEERFGDLALRLFAWQYERSPLLRRYWDELRARPGAVASWRDVPPLPVAAFKQTAVACGDPAQAVAWFETSGTTLGPEVRGRHYFFTLDLYNAAIVTAFPHFLLPDGARLPFWVLAPSPDQAPHSSLSYYFGRLVRELGAPGSRFFWGDRGLQYEELAAALDGAQAAGQPVLLLGTAFAFVHFCDWAAAQGRRWRLAPGSRAMETGGFKGRSRELPPPELYELMAATFGIPPGRIVNQYGMTELSSNFYDPVLRLAAAAPVHLAATVPGAGAAVAAAPAAPETAAAFPRPKQGPPWARAVIRDPDTLQPVPPGQVGLISLVDLANVGSCAFLLTQDLGREVPGGFVVLGRAPGAVPRGCSIAADIALGAGGRGAGGLGAPGGGR